jgi:hypothetical protein
MSDVQSLLTVYMRCCNLEHASWFPSEVGETAVKIVMYIASAKVYLTGRVAGSTPVPIPVPVPSPEKYITHHTLP